MKGDIQRFQSGRDQRWQQILDADALVSLHCVHLGGGANIKWIIEVDRASRQEVTGNTIDVTVNGGDMYVYSLADISNTKSSQALSAIIGSSALFPASRNK